MTGSFEQFFGEQPDTKGVRPAPAVSPAEPAPETGDYRPWGRECPEVSDVLEVRLKSGEWRQLNRAFLVAVDGTGDRLVSLLGTSFAVMLTGRHLGELRTRLKSRTIDYLQEFDAARWPMPTVGSPVIDRIEIMELRAPQMGQGIRR